MGEAVLVNRTTSRRSRPRFEQALTMPVAEQVRRNQAIRERLRTYDATCWANHFLSALTKVKAQQGQLAEQAPDERARGADRRRAEERPTPAAAARLRDGTLVPIAAAPELAAPDPRCTACSTA
jgi:hypothetical protein